MPLPEKEKPVATKPEEKPVTKTVTAPAEAKPMNAFEKKMAVAKEAKMNPFEKMMAEKKAK